VVSAADHNGCNLGFYGSEPLFFLLYFFLSCTHKAEWTAFQTHYFSENLVAPEIEPGTLDL
jgi:hypothetical protein